MKGCTHIYFGDGKGKTTAAMGLAIRAAGNDKKVFIIQFLKGGPTGELKILLQQPNINILRGKPNTPFTWNMTEEQKKEITAYQTQQLKQAILHAQNSQCDLLILDEIMASYNLDLIDKDMLKEFILNKPEALELVLTGRDPADYMIEAADYVTEMKKIKHPFDAGIPARLGVEW